MAGFEKFDPYAFLRELEAEERAAAAGGTQKPSIKDEICSTCSRVAKGPHENEKQDAGSVAIVAGVERANLLSFPNPQNQNSLRPFGYTATPATISAHIPPTLEAAFAALERQCPDFVDPNHWYVFIADGQRFLEMWDEQAAALGWTADELFGLHQPPAKPHSSYNRLARYDATGLVWMLRSLPVVALTETTAAIRSDTGTIITYRKLNKPALGPLGDSLDDFV
jgi:hypothetical protein